jgi:hypothetical protein
MANLSGIVKQLRKERRPSGAIVVWRHSRLSLSVFIVEQLIVKDDI